MGRLDAAAARLQVDRPAQRARTTTEDRQRLIAACDSEHDTDRQLALFHLCSCHVQADDDDVWATLLRMLDDPSPKVRMQAVHAVTDSTPRARVLAVVAALEHRRNDTDAKVRRRIRKTLAHYGRTGKITDAPN